tara:strand:- start:1619 stop:1906 length:288 start_codon:yes stop_codon:yes gene_type:complete
MDSKTDLEKQKKKIVKYLTRKEFWSHGYLKYNLLKRKIGFITKTENNYELRKLILYLVDEDIFIKKKTKVRSYLYQFPNPNRIIMTQTPILISFD